MRKNEIAMTRKLTEKIEFLAALTEHLPQDLNEWMAATAANGEIPLFSTEYTHPVDLRIIATAGMVQMATEVKGQTPQPRV